MTEGYRRDRDRLVEREGSLPPGTRTRSRKPAEPGELHTFAQETSLGGKIYVFDGVYRHSLPSSQALGTEHELAYVTDGRIDGVRGVVEPPWTYVFVVDVAYGEPVALELDPRRVDVADLRAAIDRGLLPTSDQEKVRKPDSSGTIPE